MTEYDYYSDEEYERKRQIRQARIEAEKARQQRNKKLFLGGLILFACACIIVVPSVLLIRNISKKTAESKAQKKAEAIAEAQAQTLAEQEAESEVQDDISDGEAVTSEGGAYGGDGTGETTENGYYDPSYDSEAFVKQFDLDGSKYVFTSDGSVVSMSSEEFTSEYGILIRVDDGKVIASKDGSVKMFPASMTKLMTVLTARQYVSEEQMNEKVAVSQLAIDYDFLHKCSSAGFEAQEVVTVKDLFYGTILPSGGDAAYMLALYVAGSHDAFVDMMNENCKALGISETTHFTNCVGIYDDENYSSCHDIAVILAAAMDDPILAEVLGTRRYTTSLTEEHPEGLDLSNWFLRRIEDKDTGGYVAGAKTGFVNESGSCGASYMKGDDGHIYICVSGKAWSSWRCIYDHVAAYNIYAIGNTDYHKK